MSPSEAFDHAAALGDTFACDLEHGIESLGRNDPARLGRVGGALAVRQFAQELREVAKAIREGRLEVPHD